MKKFLNKYNSKSNRLKSWDYTIPWWYFITICTNQNKNYFGEIKKSRMILNELGNSAKEILLNCSNHYPNVEIDYNIIMPNHLHYILILDYPKNVEICHGKSLQQFEDRKFGKPVKNSLSMIVNHYKGAVTRWARKNSYIDFKWQSNFYDRIIHDETELYKIRKYIDLNPLKWDLEKLNPENLEL